MVSTTCIPNFDILLQNFISFELKHKNGIQLALTFLIGGRREFLPALGEGSYNVTYLLTAIVLSRNQLTTRLGGREKQ